MMNLKKNNMELFNYKKNKKVWQSFVADPFFLYKWDHERIFQYGRHGRDNKLHKNIYGGYSRDPFYLRSHTYMLIQDMQVGVMPTFHIRRREENVPKFIFTTPPNSQVQRVFINGISGSKHSFDISEACTDFIEKTTQHLMAHGRVRYELVYKIDEGVLKSFSFQSVPEKYFFKMFRNYYQVIPWWVANKAHTRAGIIKIPKNKILEIELPKELGSRKKLQKTLRRIYKITKEVLPSFTMDSMKKNEETGFDINKYSKDRYLEIANLTRDFGWGQRSQQNNYTTEFYYFKRYLDSRLAFIILREHILEKLNKFLNGPVINLGTNIEMQGYAKRSEIEEWRSKMMIGGIKFMDLFNNFKDR